ncbi:MAG: sugar phosphate isomerase/epimerase [Caldilineaceae bacterium]|nr:sugar phosphate isomerase/epimerase [Caldilineaceae bacterium]
MTTASFMIGAFGDEIADDLETQLQVLNELKIPCLELRAAWGVNVLNLSDEQVARVRALCEEHGVTVSALGSPIGKSPIEAPIETEVKNLQRVIEIGRQLGTANIRIFSFHPPGDSATVDYDSYLDSAIDRIGRLVAVAEEEDVTLLLENEKGIVGDTLDRCVKLVEALESEHLVFLWDPANFVQVGEARLTERGWPLLRDRVGYVHIKDCTLDGTVKAAGEGDGQVPELLTELVRCGYKGMLALEPHLAMAGHSSGFSGPDGMAYAVETLRMVMRDVGAEEVSGF